MYGVPPPNLPTSADLREHATRRLPMRLLSYCLMPNHFHLVVWPREDGDLSRWMHWLLTSHVRRYHRHYHTSGHVWQGRFKAFPTESTIRSRTVKIVSDVLGAVPGIEVVGSAANGKVALAKIEHLRPNILALDLEMPVMDGLKVLRHLKQSGSDVGAIILSGTTKQVSKATVMALELGGPLRWPTDTPTL